MNRQQIKHYFPTIENLLDAPVADVAAVMLEIIAAWPDQDYLVGTNAVPAWSDEYGHIDAPKAVRPLSEAWAWLEQNGFLAPELKSGVGVPRVFVTRAGRAVASRASFVAYAKRNLLPVEILRADLSAIVLPLFLGGHFDAAVAAAFVQVEVFVRTACGYPDDLVGVKLMRRAFHPQDGPLSDSNAVEGERQATMDLFAGAIGYYKNPFSHRVVGLSHAAQAASLILVANELLAQAHVHKIARGNGSAASS